MQRIRVIVIAMNDATLEKESHVQQETRLILRRFGRKRNNLIPILQEVQGKLGYLPREAIQEIAGFLDIPEMNVYSMVTSYNQFRLNPPGKHSIRVRLGTTRHMKGGYIALDAWKRRLGIGPGETTEDREFDLGTVACVGCFTMAPVTVVDGKPEAKADPTRVNGVTAAMSTFKYIQEQGNGN